MTYRTYKIYLGRIEDEQRHVQQMSDLHLATIEALALAIEAKDETTHDHLQRVQVYATEIGKELKLSGMELEALQAAALLHDIGKIAVPDHIISKPGNLTPEEFMKMKIHPVVGAEILERVRFPFPVAPIVRCHHEKWDGTGYPAGLKGEQIPIGARILGRRRLLRRADLRAAVSQGHDQRGRRWPAARRRQAKRSIPTWSAPVHRDAADDCTRRPRRRRRPCGP